MKKFYLLVILATFHSLVFAQLSSVSVSADNTGICGGDSTQLHLSVMISGTPTLKAEWTPDYCISSTTADHPIVFPSKTTIYKVVVTDLDNNISISDSIKISVAPRPIVVAPLNDTFCANSSVTLTPLNLKNTESVKWTTNGQGNIVHSDSLNAIYVPYEDEYGEIEVVLTANAIDYCTEVSDTTILTFVPEVTAKITTDETFICANETLQLTGEANVDSFSWSHKGEGYLLDDITLNPVYVPSEKESGEVSIILGAYRIGCANFDTLTLEVGTLPLVKISDTDTACINNPVVVNTKTLENVDSLAWTHSGNGYFTYSEDSSSVTYMPSNNEKGNISIYAYAFSSTNCKGTDSTIITYVDATSAKIKTTDKTLCSNATLQLQAEAENYTSYKWTHNGDGELSETSSLEPTYTPAENESGNVQFILHVYGIANEISDTINIKISSIYIGTIADVSECKDNDALLGVFYSPNYSYEWNTGETTNQITVEATESTNYTITVTNEDECSAQEDIFLEVIELPQISLSADAENKILYVSPEGLKKYDFYDQDDNLLSSGTQNYYDYSPVFYDIKSIYVIAYNDSDCTNTNNSDDVNKFDIPKMIKVNAFSPNGDGINDLLLPGRRTKVFDRRGKILYEGWDGWDGIYNGKEMPEGSYFYILYDENNEYYKSSVTLIRHKRQ